VLPVAVSDTACSDGRADRQASAQFRQGRRIVVVAVHELARVSPGARIRARGTTGNAPDPCSTYRKRRSAGPPRAQVLAIAASRSGARRPRCAVARREAAQRATPRRCRFAAEHHGEAADRRAAAAPDRSTTDADGARVAEGRRRVLIARGTHGVGSDARPRHCGNLRLRRIPAVRWWLQSHRRVVF
jgi:hypothetical protein